MRTYWCDKCEKCIDFDMKVSSECKCGKIFGYKFKPSNQINMRTTWSATTKIEFGETTVEESIAKMNRNK